MRDSQVMYRSPHLVSSLAKCNPQLLQTKCLQDWKTTDDHHHHIHVKCFAHDARVFASSRLQGATPSRLIVRLLATSCTVVAMTTFAMYISVVMFARKMKNSTLVLKEWHLMPHTLQTSLRLVGADCSPKLSHQWWSHQPLVCTLAV